MIRSTAALAAMAVAAHLAHASITTPGYSQNFNGMSATGTAAPALFSIWNIAGANTAYTDATGITPANVASATLVTGALGVFTQAATPTTGSNNNNGLNLGLVASSTDRALGTAPSNIAAAIIQAALTNNRTTPISSLDISYDTRVFTVRAGDELRGYRFFFSTTGATGPYTAVAALNSIPASNAAVGNVVAASATINFATPIAPGGGLWLRWVDDNATQNSPDQIIGIDNLVIVPAPGAMMLAGAGALLAAGRRRR